MNKKPTTPEEKKAVRKAQKATRNARTAGNRYEQECAALMRAIGFDHVVTSRAESKSRDDAKIDLMNKNEGRNGRLPYNVQCKNYNCHLAYHTILKEIERVPGIINVIFHKLTSNKLKDGSKGKFATLGYYAILHKEDFLLMVKQLLVFGKQHQELIKENSLLRKQKADLINELQGTVKHPQY